MQGQQSGPSPGQECETEAYGPEALLMCGQVARKTETDRPRGAHGSELMSVHSLGSALKLETTLFISPLSLSLSLIHNDFIFKHYCIFRSAHIYFMYMIRLLFFVIFFFLSFCIYLFSCVESSFRARAFSSCGKRGPLFHHGAGATLHRGARASHYRGPSRCGAQAPDAQAQQLWLTGPVAPWHVGSSQARARTRVPCISRQILNHCATREAQVTV